MPIAAHLPADLHDQFDAWRRSRAKIPTVSKGVSELMKLGLQVEARRQPKAAPATESAMS
ncbi:hypothetical protein [Bradyrhizobium sp. SZCCHNRI2010]|uniref:hypothetical protein n=1 Tax=Bradyrhizobium sp. SZCCHNRI2010 TaxID=3057283 RepID=UPI0028E99090|nr:hypothetical protein [Bradyrhizobium sp. SZCCHNRI2010]